MWVKNSNDMANFLFFTICRKFSSTLYSVLPYVSHLLKPYEIIEQYNTWFEVVLSRVSWISNIFQLIRASDRYLLSLAYRVGFHPALYVFIVLWPWFIFSRYEPIFLVKRNVLIATRSFINNGRDLPNMGTLVRTIVIWHPCRSYSISLGVHRW